MTENEIRYRFTAYLCKRLCYARMDYLKTLRPPSLPLDTAVSGPSWEQALSRLECRELLSRCLTPREYRALYWGLCRMPQKEAARRMDCSPRRVRQLKASAMQKLRRELAPGGADGT